MLAPMAGVTDVGFRAVCSDFFADATVTEMISARAMLHSKKKTEFLTLTTDSERVKIAQIFGHEAEIMAKATQDEILSKFDAIDINMGCPASKIVKNGEGAALMDNLLLASNIIETVARATDGRPLSVKFRKGHKSQNFVEFARMCEESGASFLTFHGRTVAQGYSGHSDYDALASVVAAVHIPVIGSGDVVDKNSLDEMRKTGVSGVMIGRGALGKPWIFSELKGIPVQGKLDAVKKHIAILRENFDENWLKSYIRKHLLWYAKDFPLAASARKKLAECDDLDVAIEILSELFQ